jgi:hypothetical protein
MLYGEGDDLIEEFECSGEKRVMNQRFEELLKSRAIEYMSKSWLIERFSVKRMYRFTVKHLPKQDAELAARLRGLVRDELVHALHALGEIVPEGHQ